MNNRILQLLQLGFKYNEDQECYHLYVDGGENCDLNGSWYVSEWKIVENNNQDWDEFIRCVSNDIEKAKAWKKPKFAEKVVTDTLNKYKSYLQQETQSKIGKIIDNHKVTILQAKIEVLEEVKRKLK